MISDAIYSRGMQLLAENYDRKLPDSISVIWRKHLNENLTDAEFLEAVTHSILHSRFMPTAGELVGFVQSGKEVKALEEWQFILKASRNCQDLSQLAYLSDRAKLALRLIGGLEKVGYAEDYQRNRMEKSFCTIYAQCADKDARSLPPADLVTDDKHPSPPPEHSPMPEHVKAQFEALLNKMSAKR